MSDQSKKRGKREAGGHSSPLARYWGQYKAWLAGLTRGQLIRYRVLETATIIALIIIVGFFFLRSWIRMPDLPGQDQAGGNSAGDMSFEDADVPDIVQSGRKDGVYTFLLVGKDVASGSTDTMLLLTYDTKEKTIHGLNLPRDTMINVSTTSKRLNAVYSYNKGKDKDTQVEKGMAALKKEVANLTGITPDYYVIVEWEAIGELVDALGGVEFEVPFDMVYDDPYQDLHIHQKAGLRLLNGDDAMQVIRHRKNNDGSHSAGDVGRLKIQQDFLKAVAKKCLQPATFLKIPALAEIFAKNVTTDLTVGNILGFAEQAYGMNPDEDVSFVTAPIGASFMYRGAALITLDETELLAILNDGMNPYLRDIEASDLQLVYRKSNGSFGVTNGTLADERMGQAQSSGTQSTPKEDEEPDEPIEPIDPGDVSQGETEEPGQSGGGSQSGEEEQPPDSSDTPQTPPDSSQAPEGGGSEPSQGGEGSSSEGEPSKSGENPGAIDPDLVLPDPGSGGSQDVGAAASDNNPVTVLPAPSGSGELAA